MDEFDSVKATLDLIKGLQDARVMADEIMVTEIDVKLSHIRLWDPPSIDLTPPSTEAEWMGHGIPPKGDF